MTSYRQAVSASWVKSAPSARDLGKLLSMPPPLSLRDLIGRLGKVESVELQRDVVTSDGVALGGSVGFVLRSDGSFIFKGSMRATGFPSFHFALQAFVQAADGAVFAALHTDRVFGTDTPGPRERDWAEPGSNPSIKEHWLSIRSTAAIGFHLHADLAGFIGTVIDIAGTVLRAIVANVVVGVGGLIIVVGSELGSALGVRVATPDKALGLVVAGGIVFVLGTGVMFPAIVSGAIVAAVSDIHHRSMTDQEIAFAREVFGDKIPYDRITLTDLSHGGGRAYTMPSIDGSILVNLDLAFSNPRDFIHPTVSDYAQPGSLFVHELTHAWQIANIPSVVGVPALVFDLSNNYSYHAGSDDADRLVDRSWSGKSWSNDFNLEQQAHIVDDWYGAHCKDVGPFPDQIHASLNGDNAVNDPAFHFIRDNIRAGAS